MNDEDEEIQSRSPSQSPPPNGRITVPVVPPSPPSSSPPPPPSLALALPIQQPRSSNGGGGGGREDCWSEGATEILIDAWGERYLELSRGNLKQKHWQEVADIVSSRNGYKKTPKTDVQCKNRIDTVKKKYKVEKAKIAAGGVSSWALFDKLDGLIGPMGKSPLPSANKVGPSSQKKKRKRKKVESEDEDEEEEEEEEGFDSEDDGFPPPRKTMAVVKREDVVASAGAGKERNSVRVLTEAMLKFGEVYERAESAKLAQVVEMEKARMRFVKEVELQRMQFFMKMQMEISQLRKRSGGGTGSNHKHHRRHRHHYQDGNNVGMDKNGSDSDN